MIELLTVGGGALMGYVFKYMALAQKDRADQMNLAIAGVKATDESQNNASQRGGIWARRFIVLVMFSILAMITVGSGLIDVPVNIITMPEPESWFFGLWTEKALPVLTEVRGMIYDDTIRHTILAIIGYFFGQGTASR